MEETSISTTKKSPANQCTPSFTSWKLYHNPLFTHHPPHPQPQLPTCKYHHHHRRQSCNYTQTRKLDLPRRSVTRNLTFTTATTTESTQTELESARTQIMELKAELELEHKMRKKMESLTKRMIKGLAEERRGREAAERLCYELAKRVRSQGRDQQDQ